MYYLSAHVALLVKSSWTALYSFGAVSQQLCCLLYHSAAAKCLLAQNSCTSAVILHGLVGVAIGQGITVSVHRLVDMLAPVDRVASAARQCYSACNILL